MGRRSCPGRPDLANPHVSCSETHGTRTHQQWCLKMCPEMLGLSGLGCRCRGTCAHAITCHECQKMMTLSLPGLPEAHWLRYDHASCLLHLDARDVSMSWPTSCTPEHGPPKHKKPRHLFILPIPIAAMQNHALHFQAAAGGGNSGASGEDHLFACPVPGLNASSVWNVLPCFTLANCRPTKHACLLSPAPSQPKPSNQKNN